MRYLTLTPERAGMKKGLENEEKGKDRKGKEKEKEKKRFGREGQISMDKL